MRPLVLLFGMPRSGTTWVGKLLDSHPRTEYLHEPDSDGRLSHLPLMIDKQDAHRVNDLKRSLPNIVADRSVRVRGKLPLFPKNWNSPLTQYALTLNILVSKALQRCNCSVPIVQSLLPVHDESAITIWKSIESLGRLAAIASTSSHIKAIIVLRHPCGHTDSVLRGELTDRFSNNNGGLKNDIGLLEMISVSTEGKEAGLTAQSLQELTEEEIIAWRWRVLNDHALRQSNGMGNVLVLRYEDVCEAPIELTTKMLQFVGLEWTEQCEEFIRTSTSVDDERYYSVRRDSAKAAFRWTERLSSSQKQLIEGVVAGSRAGELYGYATQLK